MTKNAKSYAKSNTRSRRSNIKREQQQQIQNQQTKQQEQTINMYSETVHKRSMVKIRLRFFKSIDVFGLIFINIV